METENEQVYSYLVDIKGILMAFNLYDVNKPLLKSQLSTLEETLNKVEKNFLSRIFNPKLRKNRIYNLTKRINRKKAVLRIFENNTNKKEKESSTIKISDIFNKQIKKFGSLLNKETKDKIETKVANRHFHLMGFDHIDIYPSIDKIYGDPIKTNIKKQNKTKLNTNKKMNKKNTSKR